MSGARPEPGPSTGAGLMRGDVAPAVWVLQGSPGATKFVSREATSILHAHLEGCFGEAGPPNPWPFSGLVW